MPQEVAGEGLGVGRHVEDLVVRHSRVGTGGHVPHGVAAGLAGRQPRLGQAAQGLLDVVQLHEVELDVLAGRDVAEAPRPALGHVGEGLELGRLEDPLGNLDPQHLHVARLSLAVRAAH
jgi:hypothetical protein